MTVGSPSIWDKVDYTVVTEDVASSGAPAEKKVRTKTIWRRLRWPLADSVGSISWLYVALKLLVFDVDVRLSAWSPVLRAAVEHRFFIVLFILSALALVWRWRFIGILLYLAFFPLVVLLWKLPRFLLKKRSWTLAIGTLHSFFAAFWGLKKSVIGITAFSFACLASSFDSSVLLWFAIVLAGGLLIFAYANALVGAFRPSRFMTVQVRLFETLAVADATANTWKIKPELRRDEVVKFDKTQLDTFTQGLVTGAMAYYAASFWAYRIERYRKSVASHVFALLALIWLIVTSVACLTIMNLALYKVQNEQFDVDHSGVSLARFVYYSFSALYINEISGLTPAGTLAIIVKVVAGFCGTIFIGLILLTLVMAFRSDRNNREAEEAVRRLRVRTEEFEVELKKEYEVTAEEALQRLTEIRRGATTIVHYLAQSIPRDFYTGQRGG